MQLRVLATCASFVVAANLAAQSPWSAPVLETPLNATASDSGPNLSFDGLSLVFSSFRSGNWEIYESSRAFPGALWAPPTPIVELADASVDDQPFLAAGNLEIWFSSSRAGGAGSSDIMRSTRIAPGQPWTPPAFETALNSAGADSGISVTADGLEAYFLTTGWGAPFAPQNAIFRATRTSTLVPFGTPALVTELSSPNTHRDCEISADGLSIVYTENVSGLKVLYASRPDRVSPFSVPVIWTEFNTVAGATGVFSFSRSATDDEAILSAAFPVALGSQEIMSTRRSRYYGTGCGALTLTSPAAVIGTNWDLTTTNVDQLSPIAFTFFGLLETSVPLDGIGGVGCSAYVDSLITALSAPNVAGVAVVTIPIPLNPTFSGIVFKTQSACLTPANPLNLFTSNGVSTSLGF